MGSQAENKAKIAVAADSEDMASRAVEMFAEMSREAISKNGVFRVAISGGHTPVRFYEQLGSEAGRGLDWQNIEIFWVDERYVPPDSQWSNYRLAADTFLDKVGIPPKNVHRILTEDSDLKVSAYEYEKKLRDKFEVGSGEFPSFDLIILGMGVDGHTGSMFPNSYATFDTEDLAVVVYAMDDKLARITLTHPVICAAKSVLVLVSGAEKAETLKEVLSGEPDEVKYPIHVLWPILDKVTWLVDQDAAKLL